MKGANYMKFETPKTPEQKEKELTNLELAETRATMRAIYGTDDPRTAFIAEKLLRQKYGKAHAEIEAERARIAKNRMTDDELQQYQQAVQESARNFEEVFTAEEITKLEEEMGDLDKK